MSCPAFAAAAQSREHPDQLDAGRIDIDEGIFVILNAADATAGGSDDVQHPPAGFVAFWWHNAHAELYLYDRLLLSARDRASATNRLALEFGIQADTLFRLVVDQAEKGRQQDAPAGRSEPRRWLPASNALVSALVGLRPDFDQQSAEGCPPCPEADDENEPDGNVAAPPFDIHSEIVRRTNLFTPTCPCGGGGGPGPGGNPCAGQPDGHACSNDFNPCTYDECENQVCTHPPRCESWQPPCCRTGINAAFCCEKCCPNTAGWNFCCDEANDQCCGGTCCESDQTCCTPGFCCHTCCPNPPGSQNPFRCCGTNDTCCGPTCCGPGANCCDDTHCCEEGRECCGTGCCPPETICCTEQDGSTHCCPNGEQCCGTGCCPGESACCEHPDGTYHCCPAGESCCGEECCPSGTACCKEDDPILCCDEFVVCCPDDPAQCCAPEDKSCCDNQCCEGPCCEATSECCPVTAESCCNNECCDGPCCGEDEDICCDAGATCCGLDCCPAETPQCCDDSGALCCPEDHECCDTNCCPPDWTCCDGACCPGPCCENTGECCPETFESCCNDICCEGPCCDSHCCLRGEVCCDGACEDSSCSLDGEPATVCPGGFTNVEAVAICMPSCANMDITTEVVEITYKPVLTVAAMPSSVDCGPLKTPLMLAIAASPATPPGVATIRLVGKVIVNGNTRCEVTTTFPVSIDTSVDLKIDANNDGAITTADEPVEGNSPGKVILVNDDDENSNGTLDLADSGGFVDDELVSLVTIVEPLPSEIPPGSFWRLDFPPRVKVYGSPDRTAPVQSGAMNVFPIPPQTYVEGVATSTELGDVAIVLTVSIGGAPPCSDLVRATVLELIVDVSGDIDADTHESAVSAGFSPFHEPDLSAAVEGLPVTFAVRQNEATQVESTVSISNAGAALGFMTSTTPGVQYNVETRFFGAKRLSDHFSITPGQPATVTEQVLGALVADSTGTITVIAELRDQFGNPVADGTSLEWILKDTTGRLEGGSVDTVTKGGVARAVAVASAVPTTQVLSILSAPTSHDVPISVPSVVGSLSGPASLDIGQNASGMVTLATNAADGTPVYWTLSNGNTPFAETVVSQGTSTLSVSAAKAPFNLSRVGPCYVTAAVGDRVVRHQIDFVSSAPFRTEFSQFVIAGDAIANGFFNLELPDVQEIPGFPSLVPTTFADIPYYAKAEVKVYGGSSATYIVSLVNNAHASYVEFAGLDAENRLTLNLDGVGTFELRSLGSFDGLIPSSDFLHVSVRVTQLSPSLPPDVMSQIDTVLLAELPWLAHLNDGISSFAGGDPKTALGFAASVVGGILLVADVGSILKNTWRALPFTEGEPNAVEVTLSGLGLATELAVGVGEVADVPISGVRAIVAAIGQTAFTEALLILLKRAITNAQILPKFASFVANLITHPTDIPFVNAVFTSLGLLEAGVRAADEIGDAFLPAMRSIAEDAGLGGIRTTQAVVRTLDSLPSDVLTALRNSGKFNEAMQGLAKAIHHGGLDPSLAKRILTNTFYTATYTQADILLDFGRVARAQGLLKLMNRLKINNPQNFGNLYELQVAAYFATDGGSNITVLSKFVRADSTLGTGPTDIDMIIDGTYYQVKRNRAAFIGSGPESAALEKTWQWIVKATNDGAKNIRFVTQSLDDIPAAIKDLLEALEIEMLAIPGS